MAFQIEQIYIKQIYIKRCIQHMLYLKINILKLFTVCHLPARGFVRTAMASRMVEVISTWH